MKHITRTALCAFLLSLVTTEGRRRNFFNTFIQYPRILDEERISHAINEGMAAGKGQTWQYATDTTDPEDAAESHGLRDKHIEAVDDDDEILESPESQPDGGLGAAVEKVEQENADEEADTPAVKELADGYIPSEVEEEEESEDTYSGSEEAAKELIPKIKLEGIEDPLADKKKKGKDGFDEETQAHKEMLELRNAIAELYRRVVPSKSMKLEGALTSINEFELPLSALEKEMKRRIMKEQEEGSILKDRKTRIGIRPSPPRFSQESEEDDDIEEAEGEETEREEEEDEKEEDYLEEKEDNSVNEKAKEKPPRKLSPAEVKQKLLEHSSSLEKVINRIVSNNAGIDDVLGTLAREAVAPTVVADTTVASESSASPSGGSEEEESEGSEEAAEEEEE